MRAPLLLLALLTGCGTGLEGLVDETDDPQTGPVRITDVQPWWGPTAGGTLITVTGEGFSGNVVVKFGDVPAAAFREDADTLLVTTPAAAAEGPVDLLVETAEGETRLPDGFWYSNSGRPDTGEDTDTDVTGSGLVGGLVEFSMVQVACPACFSMSVDLQVAGAAAFHEPTAMGWSDWLPASGTCALNPQMPAPTTARQDLGEWVYLESGSTSVPLRRTTGANGVQYEGQGLTEPQFRRNASFDVNVPDGGAYGSFRVEGGLQTTEGFTSLSPMELLYVYPEAAFAAPISQYGQAFTWAPSGSASGFLVLVDVYTEYGDAFLGQIACYGPDNGAMVVPGTLLAQFPSWGLVAVGLYRYHRGESVLPHNGATLESISQFGVLGTGTLVPY